MAEPPLRAARVRWKIGQPLLPEHFYAQEESLRHEVALRFEALGLPSFGVARLRWDPGHLREGVLKLLGVTLFFENGQVVDTGSNARLPEPFSLRDQGESPLRVFLHLLSESQVIKTHPGDPNEESIERIVQRLELSTAQGRADGPPAFEIGVFEEHRANKTWHLLPNSLPALLRIKQTPFGEHCWPRILSIAEQLRDEVQKELDASLLSGDSQAAAREVQRGFYQLDQLVTDIREGSLDPHPYRVFSQLRSQYFDLCIFRGVAPKPCTYVHDELGGSFYALLEDLESLIREHTQKLPHVPFIRDEGRWVCTLDPRAKAARRVFWLLRKTKISQSIDLAGVKLAGTSRLSHVHTHALRGVPFQRVENPPFSHSFSPLVEFYALSPGEEWDHARDDGALAFFDAAQLRGIQAYLYFREE